MSSFRLKRAESVDDGLRRIARGRAENALTALRHPDVDPAGAIHNARKEMKKLRAVLRLCRKDLGEKAFGVESRRYRDAARLLSSSRDAEVKLETLAALQRRFGVDFPGGVYGPWALALELERDEVAGAERVRAAAVGQAIEEIEAGRAAIPGWPLNNLGWAGIEGGFSRTYRRGRKALKRARAEPSIENMHEWRKRAKDLTYQARVVQVASPEVLGEAAEEGKRLTDLLGDHHDFALLIEDLGRRELGRRAELEELIAQRQDELVEEALTLGKALYGPKRDPLSRSTSRG